MLIHGPDTAFAASHATARSLAFAAVAVPVTLVGHVAAGGVRPDVMSVVVGVTMTALLHRVLLARRERSRFVLVVSLAVAQGCLHWLFGGGHLDSIASADPMGSMDRMDPMGSMGPMASMASMASMEQGATHAGSGAASSLPMLLAHALAAVVLGCCLRTGERVLWAAARGALRAVVVVACPLGATELIRLLTSSTGAVRRPPWARSVPVDRQRSPRRRLRASGGRLWRGPPVVVH